MKPHAKWRASEKIAIEYLKNIGYEIIETNKKIVLDGVEISEVDAIVLDEKGEKYAVEIKAGKIDVTGIRQAVVNANLIDAKPLIVAKGFADEAAEALAKKLNIKTILLEDVFLVDAEELEITVETALLNIIERYLDLVLSNKKIKPEYLRVLEAIARNDNILDAARQAGLQLNQLTKTVKKLKEESILPSWARSYKDLRIAAKMLLAKTFINAWINTLEKTAKELEKMFS